MEQVLNLFKGWHDWQDSIQTGKGWIAATDGYAIAVIFNESKSGHTEVDKLARFIKRIQTDKIEPLAIGIDKIKDALAKCDKEEELEGVECDACKGQGSVFYEFNHNYKTYDLESGCPVCDGGGELESKPTGKFYYSEDKSIQIGETYILPTQLDRLVKAAEMLGEKEVTIYQSNRHDKTGHVFVIGALEGIVMPCNNTENTIKL